MLHLLVFLFKFDSPPLERLVLNCQVFSLSGCLLWHLALHHWAPFLSLLHHPELQAPDLVFNVFVILLGLAILDDLCHQRLQFGIFDSLRVLKVVPWLLSTVLATVLGPGPTLHAHLSFFL